MKKNTFRTLTLLLIVLFTISHSIFAQTHRHLHYSKEDFLRGSLSPERVCFDVKYYHLNLKIDPKKHFIQGFNDIYFQVQKPTQKIQIDLFANLKIEKITWNGRELPYERYKDFVFINFPQNVQPTDTIQKISFYYAGKPRSNEFVNGSPKGFQWNKDDNGKNWVGVSCEHIGASLWWPNKDHLSDEPDSMRLSFTTPSSLVCIANGKLERKTEAEAGFTTHHWLIKNPINNYNVSFYLGDYQELKIPYENASGKKEIIFYYLRQESQNVAEEYIRHVPAFVSVFEYYFGEYPFWNDKFSIVHSPYTGMEHQTCVAIGEELSNYQNWYYYHNVPWHSTLIHEIAHEWWGNNVSVADMADAWLHEGFATYCEFLFIEGVLGHKAYLKEMENLRKFVTGRYKVVGNKNVNDNTFDDGDIYFKGAITLHELRNEIKDDNKFFRILQNFQLKFKGKTVSTQDFIDMVNLITGQDFANFFKQRIF